MEEEGAQPDTPPGADRRKATRSNLGDLAARILSGRSPSEILAKLCDGDPLNVSARCRDRARQRSLLLAAQRLVDRALAVIARSAVFHATEQPLEAFLESCIDRAIASLLEADISAERVGTPAREPRDPDYALISDRLGCSTSVARRLLTEFNTLPNDVRHATFAVVIEGKTVNRYIAEGHGPPERVRLLVQRGMLTLLLPRDDEEPPAEVQE